MSCSSTLRMNPGLPDTSTPCSHMQHKQAAHQPKRAITSMHSRLKCVDGVSSCPASSRVCFAKYTKYSFFVYFNSTAAEKQKTCLEDGVAGDDEDAVGQVARVRQEAARGEVGPPLTRPPLQVRPHIHQRLTVP